MDVNYARLSGVCAAALWASCATVERPEHLAASYAHALDEGRLDDAYRLTSAQYQAQVSRQAFGTRYADPSQRTTRASQILASVSDLRVAGGPLELVQENGRWRIVDFSLESAPEVVLAQFAHLVEIEDFQGAYQLLAGRWRAQYTPETLRRDFQSEPRARELISRALAALQGPPRQVPGGVEYPLGEGKAVQLIREEGRYHIAALE